MAPQEPTASGIRGIIVYTDWEYDWASGNRWHTVGLGCRHHGSLRPLFNITDGIALVSSLRPRDTWAGHQPPA